jgi:HK97 family phage prohead protease
MPDHRDVMMTEDPAANEGAYAAVDQEAGDETMAACAERLGAHLAAAAMELDSLKAAIAADGSGDEEYEVEEPAEMTSPRAAALSVESRSGNQVQLRSATGVTRTVTIPERREMTAPITVDDTEPDATNGAPVFRGHAAVFDRESQDLGGFTEVIARGAFRKALDAKQDTVALFNHDPNYVLGRTTNNTLELREDPRGLHAHFMAPDTQYARDLREVVRRGDVSQMSFAFTVASDDWQERSDGTILRRVLEVNRLHDVSLVTSPAYLQTDAQSVRDSDLTADSEPTLEPPTGEASADDVAHEARKARELEQFSRAKRRLTLASAKTRQKG